MISTLALFLAFQSVRMASPKTKPAAPDCSVMTGANCQHWTNGVTIFGKLVWPADAIPTIIDVDLEDISGYVVDSVKSEPNNQFHFDNIPVFDSFDGHPMTYYIVINTDGLEIVRQQLSLSSGNFAGAFVDVPLKRIPGVSRSSEAVVSLEDLLRESRKNAEDLLDKGLAAERKGDLKKASASIQAALQEDPDLYEANLELGLIDQKNKQYNEASRLLTHAIEVNPASMRARVALGERALSDKDFEKAADLLSEAVTLGSLSADTYFMLGTAYYELEDYDNAELSLQRAVTIAPGMSQAYHELYALYVKRGQLDKALVELQTYLAKHPNAPDREKVQGLADKIQKALNP